MKNTLAVIMAGGKGERLMPLTEHRSKPAIPFGGIYLLIDLTLSNCINSGVYKIIVLPQYKSQTLMQHLEGGWNIFSPALGHYLKIAPPQMMVGERWYQGTADSIRQNVYLIEEASPEYVLILSGDHVYKMDYARFKSYHEAHNADVTIAVIELGKEMAGQYELQIIDVLKEPQLAEKDKIIATPTLVKDLPPPLRKVIGDLSDRDKVLLGLDLVGAEPKGSLELEPVTAIEEAK